MGVMDIVNAVGAKMRYSRVKRVSARTLTNEIGPEGIVGGKNYNTHYGVLKSHIDNDDFPAAEAYVKQQKSKIYQSRIKK